MPRTRRTGLSPAARRSRAAYVVGCRSRALSATCVPSRQRLLGKNEVWNTCFRILEVLGVDHTDAVNQILEDLSREISDCTSISRSRSSGTAATHCVAGERRSVRSAISALLSGSQRWPGTGQAPARSTYSNVAPKPERGSDHRLRSSSRDGRDGAGRDTRSGVRTGGLRVDGVNQCVSG